MIAWADLQRLPPARDVAPGARIGDYLAAVPNGFRAGGKRTQRGIPIQAARMIGLGLRKGYPDLIFELGRGGWLGLRIELKKRRAEFGTVRAQERAIGPEQRAWHERLKRAGWHVVVAYGCHEAMEAIRRYVELEPTLMRFAPQSFAVCMAVARSTAARDVL